MTKLERMGQRAKVAARALRTAGARKDEALRAIADALVEHTGVILEANALDLKAAQESGTVSYTHLDVYKRQEQAFSHAS